MYTPQSWNSLQIELWNVFGKKDNSDGWWCCKNII